MGTSELATGGPSAPTDGRTARSQRTRTAVVDAVLSLIEEGEPRPTARQVAERAGISLRSVYVHFDDLDDLFLRAAERHIIRVAEAAGEPPTTGTFAERLRAYVAYRTTVLETSGAVRRAAEVHVPDSPTLAEMARYSKEAGRAELAEAFAPELARFDATRRRLRLAALDAIVCPAAYDVLRLDNGLDGEQTRAVITELIRGVLEVD